jgi:hypothetical protein
MLNADPNSFEGIIRFAQVLLKLTEFIIQCWTFNVEGPVKTHAAIYISLSAR